jgi:hypothetical protein
MQCDEKRPVCGKCEVHFSNIKACEYRPPLKSATKKSALHATGHEVKRVGGFPAITPRPKDVPHTALDTANEIALHASLQPARLPTGVVVMTPPPENALSQTVSLGRSCGCPCHKPGKLLPPSRTQDSVTKQALQNIQKCSLMTSLVYAGFVETCPP